MAVDPSAALPSGAAAAATACDAVPLEKLRAVPLFGGLSTAAGEQLCSLLIPQEVSAGTLLFKEAEPGDRMYFIEHGRVRISVTDADGEEVTLAELRDGDFFGEMALVDGQSRSASASALDDSRLAVLTRNDFLSFIRRDQQIMLAMLAAMARRLRHTDQLLRHRVSRNANTEQAARATAADRAADVIATFGGSWKFIGLSLLLLCCWMGVNAWLLATRAFDPFPFVFLNLVLAIITGLQAPFIMMSQNRQSQKDRLRADLDYQVNLKNEILLTEIRAILHEQQKNKSR
ncbi:MAG: DUF1003 domain-containing protein [Chthoniobacterales bacterium]